jgi:phospholipid N-methyltransferase
MTVPRRTKSPALFFFQQFVKQPRMVGSVIPTSRAAIQTLLNTVDWRNVSCVVEYGPGTGVFTRALLAKVGPDTKVVAIELNPVFTDYLRKAVHDPRLIVVDGSAADIESILADHGIAHTDYVISGLPFSTLPRAVAEAIMAATAKALRPGGAFLVYQYSLFVMPMLKANFGRVDLARAWRCVPPARLFRAWRTQD